MLINQYYGILRKADVNAMLYCLKYTSHLVSETCQAVDIPLWTCHEVRMCSKLFVTQYLG